MTERLLLLDRDGTLLEHVKPYILSWVDVRIRRGAVDGVCRAADAGWRPIVVTNQSPLGRGLISENFVLAVNAYLANAVARAGGPDLPVLWCPHLPDDDCLCRKPRRGLLHDAAQRTGHRLVDAVYVGDSAADMSAAYAAGVPRFLHACGGAEPCPPSRAGVHCLGRDLGALPAALRR